MMYCVWLRAGMNPVITDHVCYTWGGLKGALPLLLGLQLYEVADDAKVTHPEGGLL